MAGHLVEKSFRSWDGTTISYHDVGVGEPLLLTNGFVGSFAAWRHVCDFFADRMRIISLDYRGLYRSGKPSDPTRVRVEDHVRDIEAMLRHLEIDRAVFAGWSMGVQINFEAWRMIPGAIRAIIAICGSYGRPFETAFNWKGSGLLIGAAARVVSRQRGGWSWLMGRIAARPPLLAWARRAGLVGESLDSGLFLELARSFALLEPRISSAVFRELGLHDATEVLATISVPTLIVAGEADPFTPSRVASKMHRRIPGAELTNVPGGTHFVPLEQPELVNLRMEKFLCDHGLLPQGSRGTRRPLMASMAS